jgi:hypothetical protein
MIIRPEAEADLVNARDWYERQREGLGAAFLLCVWRRCWTALAARRRCTRRFIAMCGGH